MNSSALLSFRIAMVSTALQLMRLCKPIGSLFKYGGYL